MQTQRFLLLPVNHDNTRVQQEQDDGVTALFVEDVMQRAHAADTSDSVYAQLAYFLLHIIYCYIMSHWIDRWNTRLL